MSDREIPAAFCNPSAFAIDDEVAIALIADIQIRKAIERGEFTDLPGRGEPLDLPENHDPDWWFKSLVKREHLTALLPSSIQMRKDDADLDSVLDEMASETEVRHEIEDFNERVVRARYDLRPGPPMITQLRDPEATVAAWMKRGIERRRTTAKLRDAAQALERAHEAALEEDRRRTRRHRRQRAKHVLGRWLHLG